MKTITGYGWYSVKQREMVGSAFYSTPDGRKVEVTEVSPTETCPNAWADQHDAADASEAWECVVSGRVTFA